MLQTGVFSAQIRGRHGGLSDLGDNCMPPYVHIPHTYGCPPYVLDIPCTFGCPPYVQMSPICLNIPHRSVCPCAPLYICMFLEGICIWYGEGVSIHPILSTLDAITRVICKKHNKFFTPIVWHIVLLMLLWL